MHKKYYHSSEKFNLGDAIMKLTKEAVLKKINGHSDCSSEFLLCNKEVDLRDKDWMLKETNRSFRVWGMPMRITNVEFEPQSIWDVEMVGDT
jgi:hypothetical protein